jgi:hypothetical protein
MESMVSACEYNISQISDWTHQDFCRFLLLWETLLISIFVIVIWRKFYVRGLQYMDVYIGVSTISACNQLICQSVHIILQIRPNTLQFQCSLTLRIFVYNWLNNGVVFRLPYDNLCVCVCARESHSRGWNKSRDANHSCNVVGNFGIFYMCDRVFEHVSVFKVNLRQSVSERFWRGREWNLWWVRVNIKFLRFLTGHITIFVHFYYY